MEKKLLATLTLTLLAGTAYALPTYYDFQALDSNKDGYLSADEYKAFQNALQKDFSQADANADNRIALDEFRDSSKIQTDPLLNIMPSSAAVSEQRAETGATVVSAGPSSSRQMRGAELLTQDSDTQGMLSSKVEKASSPTVLQGTQDTMGKPAGSAGDAAGRPAGAGADSSPKSDIPITP
ncbi:MAG TPA: EF-hand domain-containing protein [Gammaproteobacteria bacterium]|nr:EF-hand domain-containing protein [Gammaproteobacteria bacterium]